MPKIVITLPAYRAEATLEKTFADIPHGLADRVILVDDASPDDTVRLARELGIDVFVHPKNRGYGGNQKTCYTEALRLGADVIVMLHPDYQYDPKAVPLLVAPILAGDADMTFGSRFAGLGDPLSGGMPLYRYLGNRVTTVAENLMLGARFTDMHSGLRAYTRRCLQALPFRSYSNDFMFDTQLLVDAVTGGQRVAEVPIPTRYTKESSSISVTRSLRYVGGSLAYTADRVARRGRRGRRSPVTLPPRRRGRLLGRGPRVERECVLCGDHDQMLLYPSNVQGSVQVEEFTCTTTALNKHDDIIQCTRCGMLSSAPILASEQIVDTYEQVVDENYLIEEERRRELFSWVGDTMEGYTTGGRRLLEVGSNVGLFLAVARDRGWDARGIEPSKWAVEQGVERFGVALRRGSVEELDEPEGSADAVVLLDVIEHLVDPLEALRITRPVLDVDGLLVLTTINVDGLHARFRGQGWPWYSRAHLHYFTPETLVAMLAQAGYRTVGWRTVPRAFDASYVRQRLETSLPRSLRVAAERVTQVFDPKIPFGWLGDGCLVIARRADA